jgi:hypothetical protein
MKPLMPRRSRSLAPLCILALALALPGATTNAEQGGRTGVSQVKTGLKIRIDAKGAPIIVTLDDNQTSRDFIALLPLALTLEDHAATEKIGYLPRKLSSNDAPAGITPRAGDVTYYAPWGNLAIFHKDFKYSPGLVKLGSIRNGIDAFRATGRLSVTIKLVGE